MRVVALLLVVVCVLTGCSVSKKGGATAMTQLPNATLPAFGQGSPLELAELRGPMVINVWASWCAPCAKELPDYQAFSEKYAGKVDVLGVDWQDTRVDKARALLRRTGVTYPQVSDPEGVIRNAYLPKLILIDEDGKVVYQKSVQITSLAQLEGLVEKHLEVPAA